MTISSPVPNGFATLYPHIAKWVGGEEGWIEVGSDEFSTSFVRALHGGGMVWEGRPCYLSMDEAFKALDEGIATWLGENRPWSVEPPKKQVRRGQGKKR
jgi:hypothetical protein